MDSPATDARAPLRVLHVIVGLGVGGAEASLLKLIAHSRLSGFAHHVAALTPLTDQLDEFIAAAASVEVFDFGFGFGNFRQLAKFRDYVHTTDPDIIQGWMVHGNLISFIGKQIAPRKAARLAWNLRNTARPQNENRLTGLLTLFAGMFSRHVELLISNSDAALREHRQLGYRAQRQVLIPNGFDLERFRPDPETRRVNRAALGLGSCLVYGMVGRAHPQKGFDLFFAAAQRIAQEQPDARFVVIGPGTDTPDTGSSALSHPFATSPKVLRLGNRSDVEALLPALDVLCMPSRYEGFPNVLGEAMACGLPVIASDVSDVRVIVKDVGVVVAPNDVAALYTAMKDLAALDEAKRRELGTAGREIIRREFSIRAVTDRYVDLYRELAGAAAMNGRGAQDCPT